MPDEKIERCQPNCDFTKVVVPRRAVFQCSKCKRDLGIEYLFWYEATHDDECNQLREALDKPD